MTLFPELLEKPKRERTTFRDNAKLPIHNWFKYSAGFSADWVTERLVRNREFRRVGDPFSGSGTTLIASSLAGREAIGFESHPFMYRIAKAKAEAIELDPVELNTRAKEFISHAHECEPDEHVIQNELMQRIFDDKNIYALARLRTALRMLDESSYSRTIWLGLMSTLRSASHAGTASWQYVLPNKTKINVKDASMALKIKLEQFSLDIRSVSHTDRSQMMLFNQDARIHENLVNMECDAIITSPPYANNFDYADATRIEMTYLGEIEKWGDLQSFVRQHIIRSSTQHVSPYKKDALELLKNPLLSPIRERLEEIYYELRQAKMVKPGKKDYDSMVVFYFYDLANCLITSRKMLREGGKAYFVIGDSAPYGVHIPVESMIGDLAVSVGFESWKFAKDRDRNTKWKNRKHTVPLKEGFLVMRG